MIFAPYDGGPPNIGPREKRDATGFRAADGHAHPRQEVITADLDVVTRSRDTAGKPVYEVRIIAKTSTLPLCDQCARRIQVQTLNDGGQDLG